MNASVYYAQCATYQVAKQLSRISGNVSPIESAYKIPFCLRIVKEYRTPAIQAFRDEVAREFKARKQL